MCRASASEVRIYGDSRLLPPPSAHRIMYARQNRWLFSEAFIDLHVCISTTSDVQASFEISQILWIGTDW